MDLFADDQESWREQLAPQSVVLRRFALPWEAELLDGLRRVAGEADFRHMHTPGGYRMSVAMTSCGKFGWVTDRSGYYYLPADPQTGQAWPPMPDAFRALARDAADSAGFANFAPDACLINRYTPGAKLSLHQDKDEEDLGQPVVSVSLGLPATFQFGGLKRSDSKQRILLTHGDVVVWGGEDRLRYHGVLQLKEGNHPVLGQARINLTFRRAKK